MIDAVESRAQHAPDGTWYVLSGPPDAQTIALAHGVGLDHRMWDAQIDALAPKFRVLCYDMLGHGQTPTDPQASRLRDFTAQLERLLDHLNLGRIVLAGLSMGGLIAQRFAADHPERLTRLVIMNAVYRRRPEELEGVRERLRLTEKEGLDAIADLAIERWFPPAFRRAHPKVVESVRERLRTNDLQGYLRAYRVFVEADAEIGDALTSVVCPTLVMTGSDDVGSTPEMAKRMAKDLKDARVVILEGLRHMAPVEDPEPVNKVLLEFLRET